ncbi:MAG: hypothetical protein JWO76_2819 [Nocardioides sp.]|nr:hypothetical protein [Nocardioides sp.]
MDIELRHLIENQCGLVARRQLNQHGIDADRVRNEVAARRWTTPTPRVVSTTTGPFSWDQWRWLGVLHAGPNSMLGSLTAAEQHGLKGWTRPHVSVVVDDELSFEPVDGIRFFRSRRPFSLLRDPRPGLPLCRLEPSVLLFAGYEATPRTAHGVLAATVQQRLTTPARLIEWVEQLHPPRRARSFRRTLGEIDGGAHSVAELDVARMCRRFGLPLPARQTRRLDRGDHARWTDCEWDLQDGTTIVLEVDGAFHTEIRQWGADLKRGRRLISRTRLVVRCTAYELREESQEVAVDLIALGLPGRVPEDAA